MAAPPSMASILATVRKCGASLPVAGSRTVKYFWCVRMEVRITSGGKSRKAASMSPRIGVGHSDRPDTSSSRPSSSTSSRLRAWHRVRASWPMRALRSSTSSTTKLSARPSAYCSKVRARKACLEPIKRWPRVHSPETMPSIVKGTTSPSNTHRMLCNGRTQRRVPVPHFIDLGQGKPRTMASTISAMISGVGRPWRAITANSTPSRSTSWSRVRPVERRKPSMAWSGALARGPLRSSLRSD